MKNINIGFYGKETLYYLSKEEKAAYSAYLQQILQSELVDPEQEVEVIWQLAIIQGDTINATALWTRLFINPLVSQLAEELAIAEIANIFRRTNNGEAALALIENSDSVFSEAIFYEKWILSALNQDDLTAYEQCIFEALGEYECIVESELGIFTADRWYCLLYWLLYVDYRKIIAGLSPINDSVESWCKKVNELVLLGKDVGINTSRIVDVYIHAAMGLVYAFRDPQKAMEYMTKAEEEAAGTVPYVEKFKAEVQAMCRLLAGEEDLTKALQIGIDEQDRAEWPFYAVRVEILIGLYEKKYAGQELEEKLVGLAEQIIPEFWTLDVPDEAYSRVARIINKLDKYS